MLKVDTNNSSDDYKQFLLPHLDDVEGYQSTPYRDTAGISTIGHGINLTDPANVAMLKLNGYNPTDLKSGVDTMPHEDSRDFQNQIIDRKEREVRNKLSHDTFDSLTPQAKAGVMSLGYNSTGLIGPKLRNALDMKDYVGALDEVLFNSNKDKDPGIALRRLKEAKLLATPEQYDTYMSNLDPERKNQLNDLLGQIENPHTKQQALDTYAQDLSIGPRPQPFLKLRSILNPEYKKQSN